MRLPVERTHRHAPPEVRIWSFVDLPAVPWHCWIWSGTLVKGYGNFWDGTRSVKAHRWMFEHFGGTFPPGRTDLDHLCRNRACVNPLHLDPVDNLENTKRGDAGKARGAQMLAKTHCPHGHPYDDENTYVSANGARHCRACRARVNARRQSRERVG